MCYERIYTEELADGRQITRSVPHYCEKRCGKYDKMPYVSSGYREVSPARGPSYARGQFPPTPPMSYHSDYTSDSERSSRRRSGIYINDHKVLDVDRRNSVRHERQRSGDRSSYLSSSPLSPHYHHSIPPSPSSELYHDTYDHDRRDRPSSSHSGPKVTVEIINEKPKRHSRHGSSSKTSSRDSHDDERHRRRTSDLPHGDQFRLSKKEAEIARQNAAIQNRSAPQVPVSSSYRRGSVSLAPAQTLTDRVRHDEEKAERRRRKALEAEKRREEEAQQQRLKERFAPRRSSTVSYGSTRDSLRYLS
ncbi:hypothetical protein GGS20DRAFT_126658 [Poronia punctata]|nr:hypothetical protein GGS20DRAFT_126658 [Poronia punctata]